MSEELIENLRAEIDALKSELDKTKEHLKRYTAPKRSKAYYETHKAEIIKKAKATVVTAEKRKEYNRRYYEKKATTKNDINPSGNSV